MNMDPFSKTSLDPFKRMTDPVGPSSKGLLEKPKFGGLGRPTKKIEATQADESPPEAAAEPEKQKKKVALSNPAWQADKVGFNEETPVSVDLELPPEFAHKKKVAFELFAKTPKGPERISQGDGMEDGGKATCNIPVYIPAYKDEDGNRLQKVEYYFTAKHSESELLDGSKSPKIVDEMAERLIKSHILQDVTFATGKSFIQSKHADALMDMRGKIKAWQKDNPDAKLTVFGHADAMGQDDPNKALSERRAKSILAFLMKDKQGWEDLYQEEKWGLAPIQDLLKHAGHDPGAVDGQDGPKTKAAIKSFQSEKGLAESGSADADTRGGLFQAFLDECNDEALKAKDFDDINGNPTAGCSEYNLAEKTQGACEANRRVAVFLLKSNKNFPINYPCRKGDAGPCKKQVARKGDRRTAGFGCFFYDQLILEIPNDPPVVKKGPITNLKWDVETAWCGDWAAIKADSDLADGTEVKIKISTKNETCDEIKAPINGGKLEVSWGVRNVGFVKGDDDKLLTEVEVLLDVEAAGQHYNPDGNLKVKKVVAADAESFDKSYTWGQYSVHSMFNQAMDGSVQKAVVKKKVMKTWGATYVNLKKAGITGKGGNFPWDNYRWARAKKGEMFPNEYWDGKAWKKIPASAALGGGDFSTLPLTKTGDKVHWVEDESAVWPDKVEDYKYETYESKRALWIKDSNTRWTGVQQLKRKDCAADEGRSCCTYDLKLEFSMELVDKFDSDVLCLAPGTLRSNAGLMFYGETRTAMAAHEVGHLVGQPDEYESGAVDPAVNEDGAVNGIDGTTLMGSSLEDESNNKIKKRHYSNFLAMARILYKKGGGKDEEWVAAPKKAAGK